MMPMPEVASGHRLSLRTLLETAKANNIEVKDVLGAAVQKGWMSQDQLIGMVEGHPLTVR